MPKEDGSTSQVLGSPLQTFPFEPRNLEDRQPKLKVSVMVPRANTHKSNEQDHGDQLPPTAVCTAVKGHVLEHYPCAVPCFHEVPGTLGHYKCLTLTMFNFVKLHYIHTYIHTHTHLT